MSMFQEIAPHRFDNAFRKDAPRPEDALIAICDDRALLAERDGEMAWPSLADYPEVRDAQYLFRIDERAYFRWEGEPLEARGEWRYVPLASVRGMRPKREAFACAAAATLDRWYRNNRFCGRCGSENRKSDVERAMVCPHCGKITYPLICPGVIVAVTNGDRLLLTKYAGGAFRRYALIAGYAEFGEPIEDTVRREVMEEVGLKVKNLRFYKSQPWTYSDTLLMGFFCELDGQDAVHLQETELGEATWFDRAHMPEGGSNGSLTGEMIEVFRNGGFDGWR